MKNIRYRFLISMIGFIVSSCSHRNTVQQQLLPTENTKEQQQTFIAYNRNRIPVPQLLDSIDEERMTSEQLFLGEKFFSDSLRDRLLAINIAYPISNIYLIDFNETDSIPVFKDYVGYFKDGIFQGSAKYQRAFHQDSFMLDYNPQSKGLSLEVGNWKENYFQISLHDFSTLFRKRMSFLIIDESDQGFKNIFYNSHSESRGFRINIKDLPILDQKIVKPYDYYYEAILNSDGTISDLKNNPPPKADNRYYNKHIIDHIIPREIKTRRLKPQRIFDQSINTKIQLRVEFYSKSIPKHLPDQLHTS